MEYPWGGLEQHDPLWRSLLSFYIRHDAYVGPPIEGLEDGSVDIGELESKRWEGGEEVKRTAEVVRKVLREE